ncbi:MAG: hypothetical protein ACREGD_03080 [Candidatus Saccharimonadales bacterium]
MREFCPKVEGDSLETARLLTEVDHLNRLRNAGKFHNDYALAQLLEQLTPAVQEAVQTYAVTTTRREKVGDDYIWMDQTMIQTAESGRHWYSSSQGQARGDIETDEAIDTRDNLSPGWVKVFKSPKMTAQDAPREVANQEQLVDYDSIRVASLETHNGAVTGMKLDSLLIADVPLSAWIAMANDPNGLFEGRVQVPEADSALPVMQAHRAMYVPAGKLPFGALSVVEMVTPYITDPAARQKVEWHLAMFRATNQATERASAENIARRWLHFEMELADSLEMESATPAIHEFITSVEGRFNAETQTMIIELSASGELVMTRELAARLEAARRATLWTSAAVLSGNEEVLAQMSPEVATQIRQNEQLIQIAQASGYQIEEIRQLEALNNTLIAGQNIPIGKNCSGKLEGVFGDGVDDVPGALQGSESETSENEPQAGIIRCIKCRQYVQKADVVKQDCWECPKCNHKVDVCTGKTLREGATATKPEAVLQPMVLDGLAKLIADFRAQPEVAQQTAQLSKTP